MQKNFKKVLSVFLACIMLLSSAPLAGFLGIGTAELPVKTAVEANALAGAYCKTAAAEWAKQHWNDYNSVILGEGYWNDGGDCANFVSQCLYMGGLNMELFWHINGYFCHWQPANGYYDGSWIRCYQLHNYLRDYCGAQEIRNPSCAQTDIGDVIIYYSPSGGEQHTAIVVDKVNGVPVVAAHSTGTTRYITYSGDDWHLGFSGNKILLLKINGSICVNQNPRDFDVYRANNTRRCDPNRSFKDAPNGNHIDYVWADDWLHVVEKTPDGCWGKVYYYGRWGWIKLSPGFRYVSHISSPPVHHIFGNWFTEREATCIQDGIEKRVCSRCGYTETKTIKGGHALGTPPTCTQPGFCKYCGIALTQEYPRLGHDYPAAYEIVKQPTCLENGLRRLVCKRDPSHVIEEEIPALGHDYQLYPSLPGCTATGEKIYRCSRCGDSYSDGFADPNDAWGEWTTDAGPAGKLPANKVESAVQYRYRDKAFTTSSSNGLAGGWIRDDSKTETHYGNWSGWTETTSPPASSDALDVDSYHLRTEWWYYRWGKQNVLLAGGGPTPWQDDAHPYYKEIRLDVQLTKTTWVNNQTGKTEYADYLDYGGHILSFTGDRNNPNLSDPNGEKPGGTLVATVFPLSGSCPKEIYNCRTRSKSYTYHFWKWLDWHEWDFSQPSANENRQTESRTVYRYDLSALGHDWSATPIAAFVDADNVELDVTNKPEYADCYKEGVKCNRCGIYNKTDEKTYQHDFPDWETEKSQYELISSENGNEVYRAYCRHTVNGVRCRKYIDKTVNNCVFEMTVVPPTCTEQGYTHHHCTKHPGAGHDFDDSFVPALDHDWGNWETVKPATCTEAGEQLRICRRDPSHTERKTLSPLGHKLPLVKFERVEPTCTEDGAKEHYYCERCRKFFADPDGSREIEEDSWIISATGHANPDEVEWETVTPRGCGVTGLERKYCNHIVNGEECRTVIAEREIPEIAPDYYVARAENAELNENGEWVPTRCDADGILYITCRNCEHTDHAHSYLPHVAYAQENIGRLEHIPSEPIVDKEAYCIYPGAQHIVCERCGQLLDEQIIPAPCTEHNLIECQEGDGCIFKKCTNAPCTYIEPGTHDFQRDPDRDAAPTCTEEGTEAYTCVKCGRHNDKPIEPTGHHHVLIEDVAATCTEAGYRIYECDNINNGVKCGDRYIEYDKNPLGHDLKKIEGVLPTCTTEGNIEYYVCQRAACGKRFLDPAAEIEAREEDIVLPPLGHDWDMWQVVTPPTCTEKGEEKRVCKRDPSHIETRKIVALGHRMSEIPAVAPTCLDSGNNKYYECETCGKYFKDIYGNEGTTPEDEVLSALGHDWGEWQTTKEPSVDELGEEQRICLRDPSHIEKRCLPKTVRPSDENENIYTGKKAEYDPAAGEALISLRASAEGKTIVSDLKMPLDIVLVLDQSGSMTDKLEKLKEAVEKFNDAVLADAKKNNIEHRIAMVGFAMQNGGSGFESYLNTEILTTGGEPVKYCDKPEKVATEYAEAVKNALVPVNVDGKLNSVLEAAKNKLDAEGATAADLGLKMALNIFDKSNADGRKRIVLFMTDGVPTWWSDYDPQTAKLAIENADSLKNIGAEIYSVGLINDLTRDVKSKAVEFLKNVASKDELYYESSDVEKLAENFKTVATQSTTTVTDFKDITLFDTVSSAFTFTSAQESSMRLDAVESLGVKPEDITVDRLADGTTEIKIKHIEPKTIEKDGKTTYEIAFSFSITADEDILTAGTYKTNTENAGITIGENDAFDRRFIAPWATVEAAEGVVYYTLNGSEVPYSIVRVHAGDELEPPEFTLEGEGGFSGWNIPDASEFEDGRLVVDADFERTAYTVKWNMAGETRTDLFFVNDFIKQPDVKLSPSGELFVSWDKTVPLTMPAENLEFTAGYEPHEHSYTEEIVSKPTCTQDGLIRYTCRCGASYTKTVAATGHKWTVYLAEHGDGSGEHYEVLRCENCGAAMNRSVSYKVIAEKKKSNKEKIYDLKPVDETGAVTEVVGPVTVSLPLPYTMKNARTISVYRKEVDGSWTDLKGEVDKEKNFITFTTDHFSLYTLKAEFDCEDSGAHADRDGDGVCDDCGHCSCLCHKKGAFWQFIWKIVLFISKIFHINQTCACGEAHY